MTAKPPAKPPTAAQLAIWEKNRAASKVARRKITMVYTFAIVVGGAIVATMMTRRGMGTVDSIKMWALTVVTACALMCVTFPFSMDCHIQNANARVCKIYAVAVICTTIGAGGLTAGTLARIALVAAGR
jgi:hypothetical protein